MPSTPLQSFAHAGGLTFYLDTSAVFPLMLMAADPAKILPRERTRSNLLAPFLERATNAGSRAVCSVLVLEEIAAVVRNEARAAVGSNPAMVHALVLKMLEHAINAIRVAGIVVEQPVVTDAVDGGQRLRKAHRAFLQRYPRIDSMDALHMAFGGLLGCTHFVSFDQHWTDVAEIKLLN